MPVGSGFGFVVFSALPAGKEKAAWGSKPMGSGLFICVGGFVALIFRSDLNSAPVGAGHPHRGKAGQQRQSHTGRDACCVANEQKVDQSD